MKFLIFPLAFWLFLSNLVFAQNNTDFNSINQSIAKEYPFFRHVGAAYSTIFGAMAIWQGALILDKDKPGHDHFLAMSTVVVGSVRFVDGSIHLFRQSEAEKMANHNQIKDRETLQRLANDAYYVRMIRSGLIAANSALFLALYGRGDDDYKMLIYPGIIMGFIATVNLFRKTPEEKQFANSLAMIPAKDGGALVYRYQF